MIIAPAYATRIIEVKKDVDVRKDILASTMTDLQSYKKIFPALVKDVQINSKTGQAKFIINAQGTYEAEVKSTIQPDGTFVVDITSGDLKGSKIITKLKERIGFDGAPNGATTVTSTLILETSWWISAALTFVSDSDIQKAVGDGFYDLGQYVKPKYPQDELTKVDYKKKPAPKTEAAKKLDPQKEKQKVTVVTKTQKNIHKHEAAKKLNPIKESKELSAFQKYDQMPKIEDKTKQTQSAFPKTKSYSIKLDPFFTTAHIGDVITFSGTLDLAGTNPKGATVYIKDEDPLGADDILASGPVDSKGRFSIKWAALNMDFDGIADIYAIYEGSGLHPQLKTCNLECKNTIKLAILD